MTIQTRPFDPAVYLDTDEARAAYLTEALETGDPAFIADSLAVISRRSIRRSSQDRTRTSRPCSTRSVLSD